MKGRGFDNLFLYGRLTVTKILLFKLEEKMGERLKNKVAIVTGTGSIGPGFGIPAHTPKNPPKGDAKTKTKWFGL